MGADIYLVKKRRYRPKDMEDDEDWDSEQWDEVKSVYRFSFGYGMPVLPFADKYAECDGTVLTHSEVRKKAREFHREFCDWARKKAFISVQPKMHGKGTEEHYWLGSNPESWVYGNPDNPMTKDEADRFRNTMRILNCYMAASALGCGLALR